MKALATKDPPSKYEEMTDDEKWDFVQRLVQKGLEEGRTLSVNSARGVHCAQYGAASYPYNVVKSVSVWLTKQKDCFMCDGTGAGLVESIEHHHVGRSPFYASCRSCDGTGKVDA